jgi:hypothetical protein
MLLRAHSASLLWYLLLSFLFPLVTSFQCLPRHVANNQQHVSVATTPISHDVKVMDHPCLSSSLCSPLQPPLSLISVVKVPTFCHHHQSMVSQRRWMSSITTDMIVESSSSSSSSSSYDPLMEIHHHLNEIDQDMAYLSPPTMQQSMVIPSSSSSSSNTNTKTLINTVILSVLVAMVFHSGMQLHESSILWRGWTPYEIITRIPTDIWSNYLHVLAEHPVLTKAATSGTVYAIGDR